MNKNKIVVVVGVGGASSNVITHLSNQKTVGIDFLFVDAEALANINEIKNILQDADLVLIVAGLGGKTGSKGVSIITKIAKQVAKLVIPIVTMPFSFEGEKRLKVAENSLIELKKECGSIVVIQNEKLLFMINKNLNLKESFKRIDTILSEIVVSISHDFNHDFENFGKIMSHKGAVAVGMGEDNGKNAAVKAIKLSLEFLLNNDISIDNAMGIIVNFKVNSKFSDAEISKAMEIMFKHVDEKIDLFFLTSIDDSVPDGQVKVTTVVTGFDKMLNMAANNIFY